MEHMRRETLQIAPASTSVCLSYLFLSLAAVNINLLLRWLCTSSFMLRLCCAHALNRSSAPQVLSIRPGPEAAVIMLQGVAPVSALQHDYSGTISSRTTCCGTEAYVYDGHRVPCKSLPFNIQIQQRGALLQLHGLLSCFYSSDVTKWYLQR